MIPVGVTDFEGRGLHDAGRLTVVTGRDGFRLTSTQQLEKIWSQLRQGVID
ncbi:hypothetical protein [Metasolibacillus sp. FSL K6-0083]|uniref:hypothetical protein n=1 Tax=Metasolibacillus sp. FSL K6-0083 TaxID=2921416 RepID=UPI003159CA38